METTMARTAMSFLLGALCAAAPGGCLQHELIYLDGNGSDGGAPAEPGLDGVDLLFIVDDSSSMSQEQALLETSVFQLVNSLAYPLADTPHLPVDDVRAAVISTNMGLFAHGVSGDEHWPDDVPASCSDRGDDGEFRASSVAEVVIESGAIPCAGLECHCPPGWSCALGAERVGKCEPPTPDAAEVGCPADDAIFAETLPDAPNADFALELACLASIGTGGCGFEQQLASAVRATRRQDQRWFFRKRAALGVVVVSDEDDCSMSDNVGMFASAAVADDFDMWNIACGVNPQFLDDPASFVRELAEVKDGVEEAVFFAAIVGVPPGSACEGRGDEIGGCLETDEMQLDAEQPTGTTWYWRPACTRFEGALEVTKAYPGRRFVRLAMEFGARGHVSSICNGGWMPAMEEFARIIADATE